MKPACHGYPTVKRGIFRALSRAFVQNNHTWKIEAILMECNNSIEDIEIKETDESVSLGWQLRTRVRTAEKYRARDAPKYVYFQHRTRLRYIPSCMNSFDRRRLFFFWLYSSTLSFQQLPAILWRLQIALGRCLRSVWCDEICHHPTRAPYLRHISEGAPTLRVSSISQTRAPSGGSLYLRVAGKASQPIHII